LANTLLVSSATNNTLSFDKLYSQGIIVVGKRLTEWMKNAWNRTEIVLLSNKGRFVWLYIQSVHEHDHAGIDEIELSSVTTLMSDDIATPFVSGS
jgi:hypothetical protein